MANQPHPSRQAVTWRLARTLLDRVKARAAENDETVLAFVTRALNRELDRPPRDFPPNDWALIRSMGALRRYDDRMWRWTGWDWHEVTGPDLPTPTGG